MRQCNQIFLRDKQKLPSKDWTHWIVSAGRGFGKTLTGSHGVNELVLNHNYRRIGLIGQTITEVKSIMVEGVSGLLSVNPHLKLANANRSLHWENGAVAFLFGGEQYNKLRGYQFDLVWIDEFAKIKHGMELIEQVYLCLRLGEVSRMIITTTPKDTLAMRYILKIKDAIVINGSSYENDNLSTNFFNNIDQYKNTAFGLQEIEGILISDSCLWNEEDIIHLIDSQEW